MEDLTGKQFGPYQIVAPIGEGGMAAVYKAYQPAMNRYVALKVLPRHFASDPQFIARFRQEAQVLAQLQHPHILPVFDFGEADGYTYIVMPFVKSGTLAAQLTGQPLPLTESLTIISQIGSALDYAHQHGLIHRDVKPSNVLVDESGNCLLTDFGLAKIMEGNAGLTTSGAIMGTPAYMSPEQGLGQKLDARSDLYSLGVILYESVTGRAPYSADTPMAVVIKHIHEPLPLPRTLNPTVPEAVEGILIKALAKQPEERYATAEEMTRALLVAIDQPHTPPDRPTTPGSSPTASTQPPIASHANPIPTRPAPSLPLVGKPNTTWVLLATLGVVGSVVAFALMFNPQSGAPPTVQLTATASAPPASATATLTSPTAAPLPTATPALQTLGPPSLPTLGIGSTQVSEKDGMALVYIPAGEFLMGLSDEAISLLTQLCPECDVSSLSDQVPQRQITLDAYWIDQTEVTNSQFAGFVAETNYVTTAEQKGKSYVVNPSTGKFPYVDDANWRQPTGAGSSIAEREAYPVTQMSWDDATAYCRWAGRRLPTEAEWEKAARGTDGRLFPWGNALPQPDLLNFNIVNKGPVVAGRYPTGSSPYGTLDMAGSLWEWVADFYEAAYYATAPAKNPTGPVTGEGHTMRGGSWASEQTQMNFVTTVFRLWNYSDIRSDVLGFRCAATHTEAEASPTPSTTPTPAPILQAGAVEVASLDGMALVYIPAGEFLRGSTSADPQMSADEQPQRSLYLNAFWIDRTETTNAMFASFVAATGYTTDAEKKGGGDVWRNSQWTFVPGSNWQHPGGPTTSLAGQDNRPVTQVSWNDGIAYCAWAGRRLPTEAEWEKAARGEDGRRYPWGDAEPEATRLNFNRQAGGHVAVGSYPTGASLYGVLDMAGNVWEWTMDWYDGDYYAVAPDENPTGPASGDYRVLRGGSWQNSARNQRAANRDVSGPALQNETLGFRCATSVP